MKTKTRLLVAGTAVFLILGAGSCDEKGLGDADVGRAFEAPRDVIVMPDHFPNLVVACDGPTRIYVTTREAPPAVVADHPACAGAGEITEGDEIDPATLEE